MPVLSLRPPGPGQALWLLCNASVSAALALAFWQLRRQRLRHSNGGLRPLTAKDGEEATEPLPDVQQTMALLKNRRSIFPKDYNGLGRPVTDEALTLLLEAANWAPTHKRTEPWRFVVFKGAEGIRELYEVTIEGHRLATDEERGGMKFDAWHADFQEKYLKKFNRCDAMISLSMLRQAQADTRMPEWEEMCGTACAVQNMYLAATALGLACYWSSWSELGRDCEPMAKLLGISREAGDRCLGFFCIGSSDKVGKVRGGRRPIADKVQWRGTSRPAAFS